jgi:hypothetical protein
MALGQVQVIHPGPTQAPIVPNETAWLDNVDGNAKTRRKPKNSPSILRDIWLI